MHFCILRALNDLLNNAVNHSYTFIYVQVALFMKYCVFVFLEPRKTEGGLSRLYPHPVTELIPLVQAMCQ